MIYEPNLNALLCPSWVFAKGNIIRFDAGYHGRGYVCERGFWFAVSARLLAKCDAEGAPTGTETRTVEAATERLDMAWLWRDVHAGRHPGVDRYNASQREAYLTYPDELRADNDRIEREEQVRRRAEYDAWHAAATPLEINVRHFDWHYHYSDDSRVFRACAPEEDRIKAELLKLPRADAERIWEAYGPKGAWGGSKPDFSRCPT